MNRVLAINPGSTSTKIGFYENRSKVFEETLRHDPEEISRFENVVDQYDYRKNMIIEALENNSIELESITGFACRGGIGSRTVGGTYIVTEKIIEEYRNAPIQHPANLAAIIGMELAAKAGKGKLAYFVDSVMSDETHEIASFSGHREIKRPLRGHFLNQKAVARKCSDDMGIKYNEANLVVAHLGGGISIAAHRKGKLIDITDGVEEGPFTPERSGSLPVRRLVDLCYSGKYSLKEMKSFIQGKGGLLSYLGTSDAREVEAMIDDGNEEAGRVLEAMAYQISKDIGAMATVLKGNIDAIVLTGGLAHSDRLTGWITENSGFISQIKVYPGEEELEALALGVFRVLEGEEKPVNLQMQ